MTLLEVLNVIIEQHRKMGRSTFYLVNDLQVVRGLVIDNQLGVALEAAVMFRNSSTSSLAVYNTVIALLELEQTRDRQS